MPANDWAIAARIETATTLKLPPDVIKNAQIQRYRAEITQAGLQG